jgi:hypothetical protein
MSTRRGNRVGALKARLLPSTNELETSRIGRLMRAANAATRRNRKNEKEERRNLQARLAAMVGLESPENKVRSLTSAEKAESEARKYFAGLQLELQQAAAAAPAAAAPAAERELSQMPPSPPSYSKLRADQRRASRAMRIANARLSAAERRGLTGLKRLVNPVGKFLPEYPKIKQLKDRMKQLDTFTEWSVSDMADLVAGNEAAETDYSVYEKNIAKFKLLEEYKHLMNPPREEEDADMGVTNSPELNIERANTEYYARLKTVHDRINAMKTLGVAFIKSDNLRAAAPQLLAELTSTTGLLHMIASVAINDDFMFIENIMLKAANKCSELIQAIIAKNSALKGEIETSIGKLKAFEDRHNALGRHGIPQEMEDAPDAKMFRLSKIATLVNMSADLTKNGNKYDAEKEALDNFLAEYGKYRGKYDANKEKILERVAAFGKATTVLKGLKDILPTIQEQVPAAPAAPPRTKAVTVALLKSLSTIIDECVGLAPSSVNAAHPNLEQEIEEIRSKLVKLTAVRSDLDNMPPGLFEVIRPGISSLLGRQEAELSAMGLDEVKGAIEQKVTDLRSEFQEKKTTHKGLKALKIDKIRTVYADYTDQCVVEMMALVSAFPGKPPASTPAETAGAKLMQELLY